MTLRSDNVDANYLASKQTVNARTRHVKIVKVELVRSRETRRMLEQRIWI